MPYAVLEKEIEQLDETQQNTVVMTATVHSIVKLYPPERSEPRSGRYEGCARECA